LNGRQKFAFARIGNGREKAFSTLPTVTVHSIDRAHSAGPHP
jgi:hypothetical protein